MFGPFGDKCHCSCAPCQWETIADEVQTEKIRVFQRNQIITSISTSVVPPTSTTENAINDRQSSPNDQQMNTFKVVGENIYTFDVNKNCWFQVDCDSNLDASSQNIIYLSFSLMPDTKYTKCSDFSRISFSCYLIDLTYDYHTMHVDLSAFLN